MVNNKRGQEIVSTIGVTKTCHEATGKGECSSKWRIWGLIMGEMGLEGGCQGIQCQDQHVQMHGGGHAWGCWGIKYWLYLCTHSMRGERGAGLYFLVSNHFPLFSLFFMVCSFYSWIIFLLSGHSRTTIHAVSWLWLKVLIQVAFSVWVSLRQVYEGREKCPNSILGNIDLHVNYTL